MNPYLEAVEAWKRERGALCHNRIKNHFLPALATALNVIAGEIEDDGHLEAFRLKLLPEWRELGGEITRLTETFPQVAAPSAFLATLPGVQARPLVYEWLKEVSDLLWKERHGTENFCVEILRKKKLADAIHRRLESMLTGQATSADEEGLDDGVEDAMIHFHDLCEELAGDLTALDRRFALV